MAKKLKKAQNGKEAAPAVTREKISPWEQPLTLNWSHILASQVFQGLAGAASNNSANSFENATLRYNQSISPISWLPTNPNTSNQAMYGMQDGGSIIDAYVRDFLFDNETPLKEDKPKSKKSNTKSMVTDDDLEEMNFDNEEEPMRFRRSSAQRIGMMLGNMPMGNSAGATQFDPNVMAASQELLAKFPNLRMTSGIRNWGDKDAHPKGRAMDFAGPDLNAAYDYYKNTIVPKYGFNSALPLNHGTGPHIHLGYYQKGGNAPIYTDNPNDPRLRAYRDSLNAYNFSEQWLRSAERLVGKTIKRDLMNPNNAWSNNVWGRIDDKGVLSKVNPISGKHFYFVTEDGENGVVTNGEYKDGTDKNYNYDTNAIIPVYKRPVQPVIYRKGPKHPYTKSVAEDNTLPQVNNMFGTPNPINVGGPQGKSNYAFQYRDENGNQQVIYFPNSTKMAEFVKDQPWSSKSGGKDWWTINAPYLKKQDGGYHYGVIEEDMKKGGWIQHAINPKHKGYCTPMTKSTCTGHRRAFALMMKKKHGFHKKQEGGLINETGYTEGSATENNPMNIIPSGNITMANVYSPVIAVPHKNGKPQNPVLMQPGSDYTFDADYTMEFKAGGTYDLSPEHIEYLRKLGYEVEEIS